VKIHTYRAFSSDEIKAAFLMSFSLPNFFFHTTTAYDILRHKGAPLGKRDFIGKMKLNR
jgi:uncharacterized protein